jgi:TolA-binding protein
MEPSEEQLTEVGRSVRDALSMEIDDTEQLRTGRRRLLEQVAIRNEKRTERTHLWTKRGLGWVLAGLGTAAAAGALVVFLRAPVSFQVGGAISAGRTGDVIESTSDAPLALNFSEGSSIVLRESSRLRVLAAQPTGARVLVESGEVDVAIVHRKVRKTNWQFELGPFQVEVTGTKFHAGWNPSDQMVSVAMKEGSVIVTGRCMNKPRSLTAGETLHLACPAAPSVPEPQAELGQPPEAPQADMDPPIRLGRETATTASSWRAMLAAGRLSGGLRAAEMAGFDRVCQIATMKELVQLADAARLSGRAQRATVALRTLRTRFPHTADASNAAFALGRIAFERRGAYDEAVRWFSIYLDEQPSGALMGDAVGRLMESRLHAGDRQGARADAQRYIRRFPEGPYAREARSILTEH